MKSDNEFMGIKPVDAGKLLEEIRSLLNITIETMCKHMGWDNHKYYNFIKNGRPDGNGGKRKSSPSINKVFDSINYAIKTNKKWSDKRVEITSIVVRHLFEGSN